MMPLNRLGFFRGARGEEGAGHWRGFIFNEEQQQTWNNGQAKERPHPQPTLPAGSSIKPPEKCQSSLLCRDYTHLAVSCYFSSLLRLSTHFTLCCVSPSFAFSGELSFMVREETKQQGAGNISIHHQRNTAGDLFVTHRHLHHPCFPVYCDDCPQCFLRMM